MNTKELENARINWLTVSILVFYPLLIILAAVVYGNIYGVGKFELLLFIGAFYGCTISVGVGFHRLWSHGAFKTRKSVEAILALTTAATLQGPVIAWASDHRKHHAFVDAPGDPHSPLKYKSKIMGFFWSHMGWMLVGESSHKHIDTFTMKRLGKNKILVWQLKYYWQIATFMNTVFPALIGYLCAGTFQGMLAAYIFMGLGRAVQQQTTFFVNSLCHFCGTKQYVDGTPGDIWWLFFVLLGENWHNFHHAFGEDYRNGCKWYQVDVHKWIIALMSHLGLASNLICTPNERIEAVRLELENENFSRCQEKLALIENGALRLASFARERLLEAEKSAAVIAESLKNKCRIIELKAHELAKKAAFLSQNSEITEHLVAKFHKQLLRIEKIALNLNCLTAS